LLAVCLSDPIHVHCRDAGVQSAESDLKASEVTVKGVFDESKLAEYVHRRTGKHAAVVKSEPVPPPEPAGGDKAKEEEKAEGGGGEEKKGDDGGKEEKKDGKEGEAAAGGDEKKQDEEKKEGGGGDAAPAGEDKEKDPAAANLYMHYPRFGFPGGYYPPPPPWYVYQPVYPPYAAPQYVAHAPQIFSDENPNACSVM
jgi:hypothetical protein